MTGVVVWAVVLVALVIGRAEPARAAEDATEDGTGRDRFADHVNVLTYNVCASGNSAGTCAADLTRARRKTWAAQVAGIIKSRHVDVAGLTEMCYAQVALLKRELPGYRVVWYGYARGCGPGRSDRCTQMWGDLTDRTMPPDGLTFGVALVLKGAADGAPLRRRLKVDHAPAHKGDAVHPRGLLCARGEVGDGPAVSCVTHLSGTETPGQVLRLAQAYAGTDPVILTGDFNRTPRDGQLTPLYGMGVGDGPYAEADAARCGVPVRDGEPTTRGGRKIDYIFASEDDYTPVDASVLDTHPELSDHRPLTGTFLTTPRTPRSGDALWRDICREFRRRKSARRR
ncbi:endonuclease/exonuclease/phosphatase family protein [Microbispora sp. RL4-1S]|uniref:Endonuclease/exonuclease/phosphatase family protein n=1 Tax=Microbispora oryzae TaxID=2806554 RepID=A0A940WVQ4_9ACTN|nr:endonuclease/exonuclease/phosphatase family protein [Microbispora oryzae]MBP2708126.1 endonuclease/exonuclease/phosphatase family protein [Microbispora oryzae]